MNSPLHSSLLCQRMVFFEFTAEDFSTWQENTVDYLPVMVLLAALTLAIVQGYEF